LLAFLATAYASIKNDLSYVWRGSSLIHVKCVFGRDSFSSHGSFAENARSLQHLSWLGVEFGEAQRQALVGECHVNFGQHVGCRTVIGAIAPQSRNERYHRSEHGPSN
jgi:hypothetical protein